MFLLLNQNTHLIALFKHTFIRHRQCPSYFSVIAFYFIEDLVYL